MIKVIRLERFGQSEFICNTSVLDKLLHCLQFPCFSFLPHKRRHKQNPLAETAWVIWCYPGSLEQAAQGLLRHISSISKDGGPTTSLINLFPYFTTAFSVSSTQNNAIHRSPANSLSFPKKHNPVPQILHKRWESFVPAKSQALLPSAVSSRDKPSHTEIPKHRVSCWH